MIDRLQCFTYSLYTRCSLLTQNGEAIPTEIIYDLRGHFILLSSHVLDQISIQIPTLRTFIYIL